MSRKRGKKQKAAVEAIPVDILAEGSGPVGRAEADAIDTVEAVVTTEDIATTEDVVTADDVVATDADPESSAGDDAPPRHDPEGDDAGQRGFASDDSSLDGEGNAASGATDGVPFDASSPDAAELDDMARGGEAGEGDGEVDRRADSGADGGADGEGAEAGGEGDEDDAAIVFPTSAASMDAVQFKHLVEALIFASDRPLTVQRLRQLTRVGDVRRLEQALAEITEDYRERGVILQQVSGGYQFRTRTQFSAWVQQLIAGRPVRLSRAQLETLAIIAYRQPITRPEIDDIRGVDSSATLKLLIDRMLIRVLGKREEVGRPMLYGTTKEFLDFFSLGDLRELPTLREYSELTAESRKVMSDRLGIAPEGGDEGDGDGGSGDGGGGDGGGGDGGDGSGGGGVGGGGDGGDGPIPGFGHGDGTISDDGGVPASATASDLADALTTFFSAADAVDQSDAAAVAEPEDREPVVDELTADDAGDPTDPADPAEVVQASEPAPSLTEIDELAADEAGDPADPAEVVQASEPAPSLTETDELAAEEAGDPADPAEVVQASEPASSLVGELAAEEAGDPADPEDVVQASEPVSPRVAELAADEAPVMESSVIGAEPLDEGRADVASAAVFHAQPAVE